MIVEQRDYHVYTGKLPELSAVREEGIPIQQEILGGFVGAFTTESATLSTYTHLWRYDSFAEREQRRARLQADARWKAFLAEGPAADPHAAEPDPRPDLVLAAAVRALEGKVAIVTGGAQGIGPRSPTGSRRRAPTSSIADLRTPPPEGGHPADVATEEDVPRMVEETRRAPRPHRRARQQRRPLRLARDARRSPRSRSRSGAG